MALILLALDYPPELGGIQRYCFELARALAARGVKLLVVASHQEGDEALDAAQSFPTIRLRSVSKAADAMALAAAVEQALAEDRLDEPVEAILAGKWSPEGAAALLLRRRLRLPYVVLGYGREMTLTGGNLMKWLVQRSVLRGAAGGLAISHYTAAQMARRGLPQERQAVIFAGVNPEEFAPEPERVAELRHRLGLGEEQVLLTVSRLVSRKGQDQVLRALGTVQAQAGPLRYLIAGSGPEDARLHELAHSLGLEDSVIFLPEVSDEDLPALYALADVFVMPSRDLPGEPIEGFGLVYLEANLCGTPAIGGRTGGTADAILDGETGLLVDPEKPEEIAAALLRLLLDPDLARRMAEAGARRATASFIWDRVAERCLRSLGAWGLLGPAARNNP
jgi:phosphatidylinositol alpha-1,6-mannosyltransferase